MKIAIAGAGSIGGYIGTRLAASGQAQVSALARGETPKAGPQIDRQTSCPEGGPTTLKEMVSDNHDYRGQWA